MKTTIYLIRHAEAAGNINKTFQGRTDAPLTEKGLAQLDALAERFRGIELDAVYASPLRRAYETAQAANRYHGLSIHKMEGLIEIDGGELEGMRWDEIPAKFPEASDQWENAPHLYGAPGGESMRQVYERMSAAVDGIARENAGKTVVVTSHGGAIRCYLCHAFGWPIERLRDVAWEENTAVSLIEYDDVFCPQVVFHNDASHLENDQCTLKHQDWWQSTVTAGGAK